MGIWAESERGRREIPFLIGGCSFRPTFLPMVEGSQAFNTQEPHFALSHSFTNREGLMKRNLALGFWDSGDGESTLPSLSTSLCVRSPGGVGYWGHPHPLANTPPEAIIFMPCNLKSTAAQFP